MQSTAPVWLIWRTWTSSQDIPGTISIPSSIPFPSCSVMSYSGLIHYILFIIILSLSITPIPWLYTEVVIPLVCEAPPLTVHWVNSACDLGSISYGGYSGQERHKQQVVLSCWALKPAQVGSLGTCPVLYKAHHPLVEVVIPVTYSSIHGLQQFNNIPTTVPLRGREKGVSFILSRKFYCRH